jgi:integrase
MNEFAAELRKPPRLSEAQLRRADTLDALSAILSWEGRDRLATLLTDEDAATLKHLAEAGMGENTLRALTSDLAYLEAWALVATSRPLPWPAPPSLPLKFVAHHLWDPTKRESDPAHGMPAAVEAELTLRGLLKVEGPHAPATVLRRLASWSTLHQWRGLASPLNTPGLRKAISLAVRASARPRLRKSRRPVTLSVLDQLLATCGEQRLVDLRDQALLVLAFASGGRRRSEVARLRCEQLVEEPPVPSNPKDATSPPLPCLSIRLGRSKTGAANDDQRVVVVGRPVTLLKAWMARADISKGPVFRAIDRWGALKNQALSPQAVNLIVKRRVALAGLDPANYSAHGLRSGFMTEAAGRGIALPEAMAQSQHRSVQQAARYYNEVEQQLGRAARLAG